METFWESVAANALLAGVYVVYQLVNRCLHSKCKYNRDGGLDFDLGDGTDPTHDMDKIAELLKARSLRHKNNNSESTSV